MTGEWIDDEQGLNWKEYLEDMLRGLEEDVENIEFVEDSIRGFDQYCGPYGKIRYFGKTYTVWTCEDAEIFIEDFPIDTSSADEKNGYVGYALDLIEELRVLDEETNKIKYLRGQIIRGERRADFLEDEYEEISKRQQEIKDQINETYRSIRELNLEVGALYDSLMEKEE